MLDSIYIGLSGLTTFSKGLSGISNNVANLNTPGFKSSQLQFLDLFYSFQPQGDNSDGRPGIWQGTGVGSGASYRVFSQGDLRQTGNDQDTAIDGTGFFILRKDGQTFYTRDGQFQFDAEGFLVARSNNARVAALNGAGQLADINLTGLRAMPPKATGTIKLGGNLSTTDATKEISGVTVFDAAGGISTLKITFTKNNAVLGAWDVHVDDQAGNPVVPDPNDPNPPPAQVRFGATGAPAIGFESFTFNYTPPNSSQLTIKVDFGAAGSFSGLTSFASQSNPSVLSQDGFAAGSLVSAKFDADGTLIATYSNGQTSKQSKIALASFDFVQGLEDQGQGLYVNATGQRVHLGTALNSFGKVVSGSIESANVDLAQQFSELIVTQRGYQASSQIVSAANEMIQQLLDLRKR